MNYYFCAMINPIIQMRMKKCFILFCLLCVTMTIQAQMVIYTDNFDGYTAGQQLCSQNNAQWTTWSNTPGSAEDAYISTEQASSGANSLKISGTNDIIYRFSNQTSGVFDIDFNYYVPSSGSGAYFNVQHYYNPGIEWAFECFLYSSGSGYITINGSNTNFNYPSNTWFPVKIHVDLDNNSASLTVNGTSVITWTFSNTSEAANGICQLGSVNFYAGAPNNATGTYYVDDFVFTEITAANDGSFSFSPQGDIIVSVEGANSSQVYPLELSNTGGTPVNYRLVPVYDVTPGTAQNEITLTRAGEVGSGILFSSTFAAAAIGYTATDLINQSLIGYSLDRIEVYLENVDLMLNPKIQIYDMNGILVDGPGEVIYEQAFSPVEGLNSVTLTTPYLLDGRDLWFGIYYEQTEETAAAETKPSIGCDAATSPDPHGNWCKTSVAWDHLNTHNAELSYNWAITGYANGSAITPWMSIAPTAQGTIAANGSTTANLTLNAGELTTTRTGKLYLYSNDLNNAITILNVSVTAVGVGVDENGDLKVSIFPNPVNNELNIAIDHLRRVEVYDMNGRQVWDGVYSANEVTLNAHNWRPGTYMVKVTTENGFVQTEKIVVK